MDEGNKPMDVDSLDVSTNAQSAKEKLPVVLNSGSSGKGLPYAPEGWPGPGDVWTWRVGTRQSTVGYWLDRSLHPPRSLQSASGNKLSFYSKLSLEQYIRSEFPQMDVDAFFASFIWRVPATPDYKPKEETGSGLSKIVENGRCKSESASEPGVCKAGNKTCVVTTKARSCDICCSESGFCRDCCCILCSKTVEWTYDGYSFIRCEAVVDEKFICGHVAHMECALRAYMALDVQYYCRRCDNKTDLLPRVTELMKICESLGSRDDIGKILNLGSCLLRGSEHARAKNLQNRITLIMAKLKHGVSLEDLWRDEENISTPTTGNIPLLATNMTSEHKFVSVKLGDEIDMVLRELKRAQESEYKIAEQKLYAQKDLLVSLYEQLEADRSLLARQMQDGDNEILGSVLNRVNRIKQEEAKMKEMAKIAGGFGATPTSVLNLYFGVAVLD